MNKHWKLFFIMIITGFVFLFAMFAFVLWQADPSAWTKDCRAFFMFIYAGWILCAGTFAGTSSIM